MNNLTAVQRKRLSGSFNLDFINYSNLAYFKLVRKAL